MTKCLNARVTLLFKQRPSFGAFLRPVYFQGLVTFHQKCIVKEITAIAGIAFALMLLRILMKKITDWIKNRFSRSQDSDETRVYAPEEEHPPSFVDSDDATQLGDMSWGEPPTLGTRIKAATRTLMAPIREKTQNFEIRSSFTQWMQKKPDVRKLEPTAIFNWVQGRVQARGTAFYGKLIAIVLSAFFLADVTSLWISSMIPNAPRVEGQPTPATSRRKTVQDYDMIASRNLFNSKGLIPGEDSPLPDMGGQPVRTSLPLNLVGTLVLENELKSIATLEDKAASMVYPMRVQDEIPSKLKVLSIEPYRVVFLNIASGRREFVDMPDNVPAGGAQLQISKPKGAGGAGVEQVAPNQFQVSKSEIDSALSNMSQVLTQARAIPHMENGQPAGFKIYQIVPGSIYDKLGIQNGDLICGVNGQSINDISKAMEMLNDLKGGANHMELCIGRDGQQKTHAYDIR